MADDDGSYQVFVATNDRSALLRVHPTVTVSDLKRQLFFRCNWPVECQRILFGRKQLKDDTTLAAAQVTKGATLHLVARLSGGGGNQSTSGHCLSQCLPSANSLELQHFQRTFRIFRERPEDPIAALAEMLSQQTSSGEGSSSSAHLASPSTRAITLAHLVTFWTALQQDGPFSWTVGCEFLPPDHPHETVTAATLQKHREARRESERLRNGVARKVRYEGIPAEELTTTDIVEMCVRPVARATHLSYAAAKLPVGSVGPPTHFVSHAWGRLFGHLVRSLQAYFAGAVAEEVFVWLDIFAINQDDGRAMAELDDGRTLARVVEASAATLVVLDRDAFALSRLWCLYEIGSTPVHKLELLTHDTLAADAVAMTKKVDAEAAQWYIRLWGPLTFST